MEHAISVFLLDLSSVSLADIASLKALLNSEQQTKCDLINKRKQTEFILSRSLLTHSVKQLLPNKDAAIDIQERSQLPPLVSLAAKNDIQFSISHSQNLIGIAIGQGNKTIGFDLQAVKHFSDEKLLSGQALASAEYFCNDTQLSQLANCLNDKPLFSLNYTALWAKKEAYLKALQCGISNVLLKKTAFHESPNNQGPLSTSVLTNKQNNSFVLAVYCDRSEGLEKPYRISCKNVNFDQGQFNIQKAHSELNWGKLDWKKFSVET